MLRWYWEGYYHFEINEFIYICYNQKTVQKETIIVECGRVSMMLKIAYVVTPAIL